MAQPALKEVVPLAPASPPDLTLAEPLPRMGQMLALVALARAGSFTGAAELLQLGQSAVSKRLRALEKVMGTELVHRSGAGGLTATGKATAQLLETHLVPLSVELTALTRAQPVLTVAIPTGPLGDALRPHIEAYQSNQPGPMSLVPGWAKAAVSFRAEPDASAGENLFLFADEWAAVAGPGWRSGDALETKRLLDLPLVAVTPEEHVAWQLLLEDERPRQLMRAGREDARLLITKGQALGIANVPYLRALGENCSFSVVSRRHVWPGSGLWASLADATPAWDRGWALCQQLQRVFAEATGVTSDPGQKTNAS